MNLKLGHPVFMHIHMYIVEQFMTNLLVDKDTDKQPFKSRSNHYYTCKQKNKLKFILFWVCSC